MSSDREVLVMVAPNGARLGKQDAPGVPLTPEELAMEARACRCAGAAAMHLHVRDEEGRHSLDPAHYKAALMTIRAAVGQDMVVQITTEAAGRHGMDAQMRVVRETCPEAVSIALRELLPIDAGGAHEQDVARFFHWMMKRRIAPQVIVYEAAEMERLARFMREGVIPWPRVFLLFVLGGHDGQPASCDMLDDFLRAFVPLRARAEWMACAFGSRQLEVLLHAAHHGGHVRVGFENGREIVPGRPAVHNADLVMVLAEELRKEGLQPMSADAARVLLRDRVLMPG